QPRPVRGVSFLPPRLGVLLQFPGEEVHRGDRIAGVELDLPGVVEDVAAERPQDGQRIAADGVCRLAPDDVAVETCRVVFRRVAEDFVLAGRGRGLVTAVHEHLDVTDDGDAVQMRRLPLLAGRDRAVWRRPGAHAVDHGRNVRVAR